LIFDAIIDTFIGFLKKTISIAEIESAHMFNIASLHVWRIEDISDNQFFRVTTIGIGNVEILQKSSQVVFHGRAFN